MALGKIIGVLTVGEEEHADIHALTMDEIAVAQSRIDTGIIAVIHKSDILSETVQLAYLLESERGARTGHDILGRGLRHAYNVGLTLNEDYAVGLPYGLLGLIESEELITLVVNLGVGRVDILLHNTMGARVEHTPVEAHDLAAQTEPRKYDTAGETVNEFTVVALIAQARLDEIFALEASLQGRVGERMPALWGVAEMKLGNGIVAKTTAAKILQADGYTVDIVMEDVFKVFQCPFIDKEHRLAVAFLAFFLVGKFPLTNLDIILAGQPAEGIRIRKILQFHEKVDGIAALSTGETMTDAARRRHGERRMGVVMERTQTYIVDSALFKRDEVGHHINDVGGVHNAVYSSSVNH